MHSSNNKNVRGVDFTIALPPKAVFYFNELLSTARNEEICYERKSLYYLLFAKDYRAMRSGCGERGTVFQEIRQGCGFDTANFVEEV